MIAQVRPRDDDKERALAFGGLAAVVWGIAVSLYGFALVSQEIDWLEYAGAQVGGIAACLALPPLSVAVRSWLRLHPIARH